MVFTPIDEQYRRALSSVTAQARYSRFYIARSRGAHPYGVSLNGDIVCLPKL
jgi:hypothetical protein